MIEYITPILLIIYSSIMIAVLKLSCDKSNNELYDTLFTSYITILSLTVLCLFSMKKFPLFGLFILGIILGTLLWLLPISYNVYIKNDKASCLYNISIVNFTFTSIFLLLMVVTMYKLKKDIFDERLKDLSNRNKSAAPVVATAIAVPLA